MDTIFFHLYRIINTKSTRYEVPILYADNIGFSWNTKKNDQFCIVRNMSLTIQQNEIISIGGNTGVGKSTLAHMFSGRLIPSEGSVLVHGKAYEYKNKQSFYTQRARIQLMPQIPTTSFHPFFNIERSLKDAFFMFKHSIMQSFDLFTPDMLSHFKHIFGKNTTIAHMKKDVSIMHLFYACIESLCIALDMPPTFLQKKPSELSGGQLQRFALIRALLVFPHILILDEPVNHLDISIRKSTLDTILMIYNSTHISLMLISHLEEVHNYFNQYTTTTQYELKNQYLHIL